MKNRMQGRVAHIMLAVRAAMVFILTFLLIYMQAFYAWDKIASDYLCQRESVPNKNIYILAIDQKTLDRYGAVSSWSRELSAEIVQILNQDAASAPAVIGFDILYIEDTEEESDRSFATACKEAGNVVTAVNLQFKEMPETDVNGEVNYNPFYVESIDLPYAYLKQAVDCGYANTIVDEDGCVRRSVAQAEYQGECYQSLAVKVYTRYRQALGEDAQLPKLNSNGQFYFQYTCKTGGYSVISLCDLLDGSVDPAIFRDGIVLVGAYAAGMQDSYIPAISHGQQMYGVEIHANVIDALLKGQTQQAVSLTTVALLSAIAMMLYYAFSKKWKLHVLTTVTAVLFLAYVAVVKIAYCNGYILPLIVVPFVLLFLYSVSVIESYAKEIQRRRRVVGVLKKYVAPQVVEELNKKKDYQLELGGEKRNIAVMFVDIRGFTALSENLQPESVVELLNEYLALATDSIFRNSGTLDKFVGDAAMAVFNAPLDLDDYVFHAVKAAWDMKMGAIALEEKAQKQFHTSVEFGIGIHCGNAVVGNIGCEFRMDYTAIGDTVNTASRLESMAGRGQILMSSDMYEAVKDRVVVTPVGELPLKGKEKGVFAYQLDQVIERS